MNRNQFWFWHYNNTNQTGNWQGKKGWGSQEANAPMNDLIILGRSDFGIWTCKCKFHSLQQDVAHGNNGVIHLWWNQQKILNKKRKSRESERERGGGSRKWIKSQVHLEWGRACLGRIMIYMQTHRDLIICTWHIVLMINPSDHHTSP